MGLRVLVIDDDAGLRKFLSRDLRRLGYDSASAGGGQEAIDLLGADRFDCVVCDLHMPDVDGLDVLRFSTGLRPPPPFIVLTAYGSVKAAVEAMKHGAADFVEKPVASEELSATIKSVVARAPQPVQPATDVRGLVGSDLWLGPFLTLLERVAKSNATVLIEGETGTGKTAVAKQIWRSSNRSEAPFVELNCAAIPEHLMESELFGHKKGAFTGADDDYEGKVSRGDGGTIFLDEVGELKPELQAKLLHLLQERTYTPLGSSDPRSADVRFVAATNRNLAKDVEEGRFRRDLFHRLEVVSLTIPPLRERTGDLPVLVDHFKDRIAEHQEPPKLSEETLHALCRYDWPGNVRELENLIERFSVMFEPGTTIAPEHLPKRMLESSVVPPEATMVPELASGAGMTLFDMESEGLSLSDAVKAYESSLIAAALERADNNRSQAAKLLRMKRTTLVEKIKKL